jgi:hypothetical protein
MDTFDISDVESNLMNKYRKFITSSVGFTFMVVGFTGIIFKFFFKTHPLEEIHGWLGTAMVAAALFHIAQNWGPLKSYLRQASVLALLVPVVLVIAFFSFAPAENGRGPNPKEIVRKLSHGKTSDVAAAFGQDVNRVVSSMQNDGIQVASADETIEALARENNRPPEALLAYFVKNKKDGSEKKDR